MDLPEGLPVEFYSLLLKYNLKLFKEEKSSDFHFAFFAKRWNIEIWKGLLIKVIISAGSINVPLFYQHFKELHSTLWCLQSPVFCFCEISKQKTRPALALTEGQKRNSINSSGRNAAPAPVMNDRHVGGNSHPAFYTNNLSCRVQLSVMVNKANSPSPTRSLLLFVKHQPSGPGHPTRVISVHAAAWADTTWRHVVTFKTTRKKEEGPLKARLRLQEMRFTIQPLMSAEFTKTCRTLRWWGTFTAHSVNYIRAVMHSRT